MAAEDLDDEGVIEHYEYILEREPSYEDVKNDFFDEVWAETDDGEDFRVRIERGIREGKSHDNLLESTISVFLPGGEVHSETNWKFLGAEPLSELNEPNADLIIGNEDRNLAVIVECKSGLSRPGQALTQLYNAADAVREYREELEENIGMEIADFECAICVSSTDDVRITREIESHERSGEARERVFVWRLHYLQNGEQLDLFTRIETRSSGDETHDNQLAEVLQGGVDITEAEHATPSFFPSSHLYRVMEEVFSTILTRREVSDDPIRHFSGEEVLDILTDQRHLPHYDADEIGGRMYLELMERLLEFDIITKIEANDTELEGDGEFYRYRGRGRSRGTILNDICEGYKDEAVEWEVELEAMRRTINQFDEEQSRIGDF